MDNYWNYRIFRHVDEGNNEWYTIHECYYNDKGKPTGWTENPVRPFGSTVEELKNCLYMMDLALNKPILDY